MKERVAEFLRQKRKIVDEALADMAELNESVPSALKEAMHYSLFAGGKRLRPILTLTTAEALSAPAQTVIPAACAIEMIHTYSLIHDDLPAMDDDDTRRGRPTNHKVFGEAMAILAGDALLTKAFGLMTASVQSGQTSSNHIVQLIAETSLAAGAEGMVGGQAADLQAEKKTLTVDELMDVHRRKTGALLRLSVRAGAMLAGANNEQLQALTLYADNVGLAFQIRDDILDVVGDQHKIGKPVGSDATRQKSTYPALLGLSESSAHVHTLIEQAKRTIIEVPGIETEWLCGIADYLVDRDH